MGSQVKAAVRRRVEEGLPIADLYGRYYDASDLLDLDAEGSPMGQDTTWYFTTDGDLYMETENGRRPYHGSLDPDLVCGIDRVA